MENNLTVPDWEDEEYKAFKEKFKAKKTTDDCYTPENVYNAVAEWVESEYGVKKETFVRPFFPGGDFEKYPYKQTDVVVDNPPFSIITKIRRFYVENGIHFFLFAPALTLFSSSDGKTTLIPCGVGITYENGANMSTSFITNLDKYLVRTAPALYKAVKQADEENRKEKTKTLPKYEYPENIITAAMVQRWCKYGVDYKLSENEALPISALDAQKARDVTIFGGGFILGTKSAAERAAAERAAAEKWTLSETEKQIVKYIDERSRK